MKQKETSSSIEESNVDTVDSNETANSDNGESDQMFAFAKKYKTDPDLGKAILDYLSSIGVATPVSKNSLSSKEKRRIVEELFYKIMKTLELDLKDDSLRETPSRIAKMYVDELFFGLDYRLFPRCTTVENKMNYNEVIIERNINVQSVCEHHFVPIDGFAHVGYIPEDKVIGLSKINRIVEFFCKRPQIQERLTEQIFFALKYILQTDNIAVVMKARHFCVKSRGIEDVNSDTITSKVGGVFLSEWNCRQEFLSLARV